MAHFLPFWGICTDLEIISTHTDCSNISVSVYAHGGQLLEDAHNTNGFDIYILDIITPRTHRDSSSFFQNAEKHRISFEIRCFLTYRANFRSPKSLIDTPSAWITEYRQNRCACSCPLFCFCTGHYPPASGMYHSRNLLIPQARCQCCRCSRIHSSLPGRCSFP